MKACWAGVRISPRDDVVVARRGPIMLFILSVKLFMKQTASPRRA